MSFHGNDQIPTPNIDALGYQGQILNRHYVAAMCTPSRSALMTGKYMIRTGMQHFVIENDQPWGLPTKERLLPEYLRDQGYHTSLIGKWHLGFAWRSMAPMARGFDRFQGYLGGYEDYYSHRYNFSGRDGYDWRRGWEIDYEDRGRYATDVITDYAAQVIRTHNASRPMFLVVSHLAPHSGNENDPMQVPEEEVRKFEHIEDPVRRVYAAMVGKLDESVGRIVTALREKEILANSVILFSADNGAPTLGMLANKGSNFPLRGVS